MKMTLSPWKIRLWKLWIAIVTNQYVRPIYRFGQKSYWEFTDLKYRLKRRIWWWRFNRRIHRMSLKLAKAFNVFGTAANRAAESFQGFANVMGHLEEEREG